MNNLFSMIESLVEALFFSAEKEKRVYFPWLYFGTGYEILDQAKSKKITVFLRNMYLTLILGGLFCGVLLGNIVLFLFLLGFGSSYYYFNQKFLNEENPASISYKIEHRTVSVAKLFSPQMIRFFMILSAIFVGIGAIMVVNGLFLTKILGLLIVMVAGVKTYFFEISLRPADVQPSAPGDEGVRESSCEAMAPVLLPVEDLPKAVVSTASPVKKPRPNKKVVIKQEDAKNLAAKPPVRRKNETVETKGVRKKSPPMKAEE